ncbi:hypothetical protein Cni_G16759 [Canna indica]|uniref:Prolamin-like domain-containing protein n=1 Tax=Canna indica TaxID=4628 RepID=A0AAQ3QG57_9LILI|nr:hypothetical protein Cni_G16759 [Canna indica]
MSSLQNFTIALILASLIGFSGGRDLPNAAAAADLEARLMAVLAGGVDRGGFADCWNALLDLRSCTGEIALFFLNGESYLGRDCCHAVRVITRHCWTSMLSTLGLTAQESDILRGYCDGDAPVPAPALPPAPVDAPSDYVSGDGLIIRAI